MSQHARPHLQTHTRSSGHSAVAGAAYRLGLRLYDERTQTWHDYRKRELGEEIVRALTVAPLGAPAWATDPTELWNRAEAAEKRKDAQVARDYRIPIPFGLSDAQAGDLAEHLARFIAQQLTTAVSVGLHRDADVDALGVAKSRDKVGYHAHLYFPTRQLICSGAENDPAGSGFGAKLSVLSNKRTSAGIVEQFNAKWAELWNQSTAALGLPADYDHRSYLRQGLPTVPQRTLGAPATALERKGFFTRKGDAVREIVLMSKVYELAHVTAVAAQTNQAVADVSREASVPIATPEPSEAPALLDRLPLTRRRHARSPRWEGFNIEPEIAGASTVDAAPLADTALLARFRATAPVPVTPAQHDVFARLVELLRVIERALRALRSFAKALVQHDEDQRRRTVARLDTDTALDDSRAQRAEADVRLKKWEATHRWQMMRAKAIHGKSGRPRMWRELSHEIQFDHRHVQDLKTTARTHLAELADLVGRGDTLKARQSRVTNLLRSTVGQFAQVSPEHVPPLLAVLPKDDRHQVEVLLPKARLEPDRGKAMDGPAPKPPRYEWRSAGRPVP